MKRTRSLAFLAAVLLGLPRLADAADPTAIYGRWAEKLPNGNSMVTEFGPALMDSYMQDASGQKGKEVGRSTVSYKNLSPTTVGVDFQGGGGIMLTIKDPKTLLMDFPGMGAHTLTKLEGN